MLGEKIRNLRKENKISQEELAEKLGVSRQSISLWENDQTMPSIENIVAIANIFDVSTDVLLKDDSSEIYANNDEKPKKSVKKKLLVVLSIVLGMIIIGVSTYVAVDKFSARKLSAEEIFDLIAPSTVEINATSLDFSSTGTGFFIDDKGTVITNYHVIESCFDADIVLQDGTEHPVVSVLGYDKDLDVAILSTGCATSVPLAYREDSVSTGETAYVIGSSLGLTGTFAEGIVSSANRKIQGHNFIQTSAPISSGNSGGPLVDKTGKVIGITTAGFEEGQNLNLAIPIVLALNVERDDDIKLKEMFLNRHLKYDSQRVMAEFWLNIYIDNPTDEIKANLSDYFR